MTLAIEIQNVLSGWPAFAEGTRSLIVESPAGRLSCEMTALDLLACSFTDFTWSGVALAGAGLGQLKRVAEQLARRLTYLLEPIAVLEADPLVGVVQLRSSPPQRDAAGATYYELLASREGSLHLSRFHRAPGQPRSAIAAQVTREVLGRLAGDFAAATSPEAIASPSAGAAKREARPDIRSLFGR
jgi:hypothetical protein